MMNVQLDSGHTGNKRRKGWSKQRRVLSIGALCAALLLSAALIATVALHQRELAQTETLRQLYHTERTAAPLPSDGAAPETQAPDTEKAHAAAPHQLQARFVPLLEQNPETIGWLRAGSLADEPVVYRDNDFYLHHDFLQNKSSSGTVFVDAENADWETAPYVVVYGHYIKDGSRFGSLKKYCDAEQLKKNLLVEWDSKYSSEPEAYVVFSVFEASMLADHSKYFYLRRFEQLKTGGEEQMQQLIDEAQERSLFDIPLDVTPEDRILVLVTCSYGTEDGRLLVFCRKVRPEEDVDALLEAAARIGVR